MAGPADHPETARCRDGPLPVVPQQFQQSGRQHDIAVFAALALYHPDHHAPAVDGVGGKPYRLTDAQARRIVDGQDHAVLQVSTAARKRPTSSWLITTGSFLACLPAGMSSLTTQGRLSVMV